MVTEIDSGQACGGSAAGCRWSALTACVSVSGRCCFSVFLVTPSCFLFFCFFCCFRCYIRFITPALCMRALAAVDETLCASGLAGLNCAALSQLACVFSRVEPAPLAGPRQPASCDKPGPPASTAFRRLALAHAWFSVSVLLPASHISYVRQNGPAAWRVTSCLLRVRWIAAGCTG